MFIQTEGTPNPATLKFLPGRVVMRKGTADFSSAAAAAERSPLAQRLFEVEGVTGVFLGMDFITVSKADAADWAVLKPQILAAIMEHFSANLPVVDEAAEDAAGEGDSELVAQIRELIETRVRPAVAQDGGDIIFRSFEDGVVYVSLQGACSGCPSSTATLKHGIENMLRYYVPEVQSVQQVY
jgi:Fe-S cluster biogenesis protein NfuA